MNISRQKNVMQLKESNLQSMQSRILSAILKSIVKFVEYLKVKITQFEVMQQRKFGQSFSPMLLMPYQKS